MPLPLELRELEDLEAVEHSATNGRPASRLLSIDDLNQIASPLSLVAGRIGQAEFVVHFGAPGSYKSAASLDLSLCVSAGIDWHGHTVRQGPTVFIAGEGLYGVKLRISAWRQRHPDADLSSFWLLPQALALLDASDVTRFIDELLPVAPVLVTFDTLARCLAGGDENSTKEMSSAVTAVDRIRTSYGAACNVVHHSGWEGARERGSSALRGAADAVYSCKRDENAPMVTIHSDKQKDREDPPDLRLTRDIVALDHHADEYGSPLTSIALQRVGDGPIELNNTQRAALTYLLQHEGSQGLTAGEWESQFAVDSGTSHSGFHKALDYLKVHGLVHGGDGRKGSRYRTSEPGLRALE